MQVKGFLHLRALVVGEVYGARQLNKALVEFFGAFLVANVVLDLLQRFSDFLQLVVE